MNRLNYNGISSPNSNGGTLELVVEESYDEWIAFHYSKNYLKIFRDGIDLNDEFPLLINHEFILANGTSGPIEGDKNLNDLSNKELLQTVLNRVKQFSLDADRSFKLIFLENLTSYAEKIGLESTIDILIPILSRIPDEVYSIKLKFLENFKGFLEFIAMNKDKGYQVIKTDLLRLINEFFVDKTESEIIKLSSENLIAISRLLAHEDLGSLVLTTLISFANDDSEQQSRIESRSLASKLFGDMADLFGRELTELYIVPQIAGLSDDEHFKVRKSVASNLTNIAAQVSLSAFDKKILPIYER